MSSILNAVRFFDDPQKLSSIFKNGNIHITTPFTITDDELFDEYVKSFDYDDYFDSPAFSAMLQNTSTSRHDFISMMPKFMDHKLTMQHLYKDFKKNGVFYRIFKYYVWKSSISLKASTKIKSSKAVFHFDENSRLLPGFEQIYFSKYYPLFYKFSKLRSVRSRQALMLKKKI